jgi:hypothetical protein
MEFTSWKYLVTFKSYTNKRTENTCPGFPPLKNTDLGYQMSIFFFKTLYQVKALNIFFIVEFTSWKYLIPFKSYTYKHSKVIPINVLENTCPGFKPSPSKIDKQTHFIDHTCTCITAIKQYDRFDQSVSKFNFYFLGRGHLKYLYLCGGTPKIIKILVVVSQIINRVPTSPPPGFFSWKSPN